MILAMFFAPCVHPITLAGVASGCHRVLGFKVSAFRVKRKCYRVGIASAPEACATASIGASRKRVSSVGAEDLGQSLLQHKIKEDRNGYTYV